MANAPQSKIAFRELSIGFAFGAIVLWAIVASIDKGAGKNSPIKVVGGSIKFKTQDKDKAWTPVDCAILSTDPTKLPCLISGGSIDGSQLALDNATLTNLIAWKILVNAYAADAKSTQLAATVYPSDKPGVCTEGGTYTETSGQKVKLCTTSADTYITSQAASAKKLYAPDAPYDKLNSKTGIRRRYRYRDTDCCKDGSEDYRESISDIAIYYQFSGDVPQKLTTSCGNNDGGDNGDCKVSIGPIPGSALLRLARKAFMFD